jgi:hypothetical protein
MKYEQCSIDDFRQYLQLIPMMYHIIGNDTFIHARNQESICSRMFENTTVEMSLVSHT